MKVLNIRKVPDQLFANLKASADLAGTPFHEYCLQILRDFGQRGDLPGGRAAPAATAEEWDGVEIT